MTDRSGLRAALDGELLEVGSSGYDAARRPAGARFAVARPELVVRCRSQSDVLVALEHARRIGIPVAVRGGGHCFAGPSSTDAMQVDLTGLHGITVTPAAGPPSERAAVSGTCTTRCTPTAERWPPGAVRRWASSASPSAAASVCSAGCTG